MIQDTAPAKMGSRNNTRERAGTVQIVPGASVDACGTLYLTITGLGRRRDSEQKNSHNFHSAMSTLQRSVPPKGLTGIVAHHIVLLNASNDFVDGFGVSPTFNFEVHARKPPKLQFFAIFRISTCIKCSATGQDNTVPFSAT